MLSIWFSQKRPDMDSYRKLLSLIYWIIVEDVGGGLCVSYTGNIFPTGTTPLKMCNLQA